MSLWRLAIAGAMHYRRSSAAVALGIAAATSVLTGSLVVGDSMKRSLRDATLERLGDIDQALVSRSYFTEALADRISSRPEFRAESGLCAPVISVRGSVRKADSDELVPGVNVIGIDRRLVSLWSPAPPGAGAAEVPELRKALMSRALAARLPGAKSVIVSIGSRQEAPEESIFAGRRREETLASARLDIAGVVGGGWGEFKLANDSPPARNLFVPIELLQRLLDALGRANVLLVSGHGGARPAASSERMQSLLAQVARLEDYSLRLRETEAPGRPVLQSDEFVLPPAAVRAATALGFPIARSSVNVAVEIRVGGSPSPGKGIPYSVVAALDGSPGSGGSPFGRFEKVSGLQGPPGDDELLLNAVSADSLGAKVGDSIEIEYFARSPDGSLGTRTMTRRLRGVVAMSGDAVSRAFVPVLRGITDADRPSDWKAPFPVDFSRIRPSDDEYWRAYRTAPKAYLSMASMKEIWEASEGPLGEDAGERITSVHFGAPGAAALPPTDEIAAMMLGELSPDLMGLAFRPVREEALRSAEGSTDFGVLFLSMSFFIIVASAALVGLLVRLAADRRASQTGILLATGFTQGEAARVVVREGMLVAGAGVLAGVPAGLGYAWLVLKGLSGAWSGALGEMEGGALGLHPGASSLAGGAMASLAVSYLAVRWGASGLKARPVLRLLGGWKSVATGAAGGVGPGVLLFISGIFAALAAAVIASALAAGAVPIAAAFFAGGASLLVAMLLGLAAALRAVARRPRGRLSLARLGLRSAAMNPLRSVVTAGLLSCASFIVVAVASNRSDLRRESGGLSSGSGGIDIVAQTDVPVHVNIGSKAAREELRLSKRAQEALAGCSVWQCRLSSGDEASCLNMQRPLAPRVRSVPDDLLERGGFSFASHEPLPAGLSNPWLLLRAGESGSPEAHAGASAREIPAFADAATAQWILHVGLGDRIEIPVPGGRAVLRLVGLLRGSIFAGDLVVSERGFIRAFGPGGGYRGFLIAAPGGRADEALRALSDSLAPLGFDGRSSGEVLASYARVQNTYLAAFSTLGGLGLLLGTFGVVAVMLRNIVDYRGELAMMLAMGWSSGELVRMVLVENWGLLTAGVVMGSACALLSQLPQLARAAADVQWASLSGVVLAAVVTGVLACAVAARAMLGGSLMASLRSE